MSRAHTPATLTALEALYDTQGEAVYRYLLGMLGCREDAEDAVQTVWLKLARARLDRIRDLPAYLWTAARHHAATVGRRRSLSRRRVAELTQPEMLPTAENPGRRPDELRDIEHAVLRLSPKHREMVVLVGLEGLTLKEAGERLGIPAGTAASRYRTAVSRLRSRLKAKVER